MTNNKTLFALASFNNNNGAHPQAALVQGSDGSFYGTAVNGGISDLGTVFKMTANVLTNLVSFAGTNGWLPYGGLVQGADGSFYGTTSTDTTNGSGTVFNVTTNGTFTNLYLFTAVVNGTNADGANPSASLVQGADGNFYGTTQNGGAYNSGTIFQITPGGTLTSL